MASISLGELHWGVQRAQGAKGAKRSEHVGLLQASLGSGVPFDDSCAARYGYLCALTEAADRRPRGRAVDLMIAAVAMQSGAALATVNVADFEHLARELPLMGFSVDGEFTGQVS